MTSSETLRKIFKSPFDYTTYCNEIVHNIFGCNDIATSPEQLPSSSDGDQNYFIGRMADADSRELGFFYTRVAEGSDVRRKRVGLRKLIAPYLKYEVDAAIAVFDDGNHWRLSYICDMKEGTTAAKRFSYILGDPQGQYKTPIERLSALGTQTSRLRLCDIRDAFSVDALSKEFFDEYHRHYDRICDYIIHSHINTLTHLHIHDYVKKMMGRIVFLHFLQKKGWLNGNLAFLRDLFFFSPHQGDFLEQVLEPLFFGIFNTEKANREQLFKSKGWDMGLLEDWKELPYLNGGLYERDAVDEQNITLPASLFEDLFTFMASYNFTVDENDPDDAEVGVDPEMLGKIFESLLEDNKAKGAFYTPKEIVRYMCKESLIAYLSSRVSESPCPAGRNLVDSADASNCERSKANNNLQDSQDFASETSRSIRRFVETHEMQPELEPYRDILDAALRNVKICDPAIGSGAFPMGLLNELWRCREALYSPSPAGRDLVNLVDSADASNCKHSNAKDNLQDQRDFVSAASRSKLKKEIIENNIYGVDIEKGAIDIARLRFWLSIVVDADKPEPLPNFDYKFMQGNSLIESFEGFDLSRISSRLRGGQSKSMQLVLGIDSHTSRQNLQRLLREYFSVTDHKKKSSMREAINEEVKTLIRESVGGTPASLAKLEKMDCSANQDFFLWHTWFKDIFDNGGFDIVIGNPPYISAVEMVRTECEKALYKKTYPQATGAYDIYVLFLLRGLMLSKNVFFWIIPNKFLIADYAQKTKELLEQKGLYSSIDVSVFNVFENASVYPIIVCGSKLSNRNFCKYSLDYYEDLLSNKARPVKELEASFMVKDCGITVCSGATGFEAQKIKEYVVDGERDNVIPFTVSGNIDRYFFNNRDVRYMKSKFYNAYIRLDCDVANSKLNMWMSPKIVIAGMTKVIESTYVETPLAIGVGVYAITSFGKYNPYFITGLLNSKYTSYYLRNKFKDKHLAGGYLAINKSTIEQLPFINADKKTQELISSKVKEILLLKQTNPYADTASIEREIDQKVYDLYNLTPEEIAIIEQ